MKNKKRFWIILAIIVAVLIVGIIFARNIASSSSVDQTTFTVRKETFENTIEISGNISAASSQTLKAAGDGTIQKVYVKKGDFVKRGQIIIQLDAMQQEYNLAKLDYDIEQTKISGSVKELQLMKSQRDVMLQQLDDRRVIAYFDGIIVDLSVAEGDYVEAKDTVGTIINRTYMKADVEVVETDVPKLEIGQVVHFTFPSYPDLDISGYVKSYPAVGRISTRGATVVDTEVRIDNPPNEILPNFSFTGKIEITPSQSVLIVERQAIGYEAGKSYAEKVLTNGSTEKVDVVVTPYDTDYVSITSGLEENDVIKNQGSGVSASSHVRVNSSKSKNSKDNQNGLGGMMGGGPGGGW